MTPTTDPFDLQRFIDAQNGVFEQALSEMRGGQKRSHWMWFVFPQIEGLGMSAMSRRYAIRSIAEATAYLDHRLLGTRFRQCVEDVLGWAGKRDAVSIFGPIDAMKFRSSLTLFATVSHDDSLLNDALDAFFDSPDAKTLGLLGRS